MKKIRLLLILCLGLLMLPAGARAEEQAQPVDVNEVVFGHI